VLKNVHFNGPSCIVCFQLMIPPILYEYVNSFLLMDGSEHLSLCEALLCTLNQLMPQCHELTDQLTNGRYNSYVLIILIFKNFVVVIVS